MYDGARHGGFEPPLHASWLNHAGWKPTLQGVPPMSRTAGQGQARQGAAWQDMARHGEASPWSRRAAVVLLVAFLCFLVVAATAKALLAGRAGLDPHPQPGDGHRRVLGRGQVRFDGFGPERWALRFRHERQIVERLRQRLRRERLLTLRQPNVAEAIELAAATYGNGDALWRKAQCESRLNPGARNLSSAASGLFQFLPSTWSSTPYGRFSVYSPYANALAAGWMHANGRGGEWVCR